MPRKIALTLCCLTLLSVIRANSQQLPTPNYYPVPNGVNGNAAITGGPDDNLWFTSGGFIGRMDISGRVLSEYPLPGSFSFAAAGNGITTGMDGNVWFATQTVGLVFIGRLCLNIRSGGCKGSSLGTIRPYQAPTQYPPDHLVPGPDGNLWFNDYFDQHIDRVCIEPNDSIGCDSIGVIKAYLPDMSLGGPPHALATGPDGHVWFAVDSSSPYLQALNMQGKLTGSPISLRENDFVYAMTTGADGALWFTDVQYGSSTVASIGRVCIQRNTVGCSAVSAPAYCSLRNDIVSLFAITAGPDGAIWFTGNTANSPIVGRLATPPGGSGGTPCVGAEYSDTNGWTSISAGADGALWFVGGGNVGHQVPIAIRNAIDTSPESTCAYSPDIPQCLLTFQSMIPHFQAAGVKYAVVKASRDFPNISHELLQALHDSFRVGAYCFMDFHDPTFQSGETQAKSCLSVVGSDLVSDVAFVALDVETRPGIIYDEGADQDLLRGAISALRGNTPIVIYTNYNFWKKIIGLTDTEFDIYRLWRAGLPQSYIGNSDLAGTLRCFQGSVSLTPVLYGGDLGGLPALEAANFGGWTSESGNQYDIGENGLGGACLFATAVDFDIFDPTLFGN